MPIRPSPGVMRAGELLSQLMAHPLKAFTVSELARQLEIPRATCHSLLLGLVAGGFVRRDGDLRYRLGSACIVLGEAARLANPGLAVAEVHAEQLAKAEKVVVGVTVRDGLETRVARVFDHGAPFGVRPRAGDAIALVPPFGASFVAWDAPADVQAWLDRADPALTPAEAQRYAIALHAVRVRGYSVTVSPQPGD
jgi:DNA-binding IclR family transcriptional regulator